LEGDLLALPEIKEIAAQDLYREKNYTDAVVLDVSRVQTTASRQFFPQAEHLPQSADFKASVRELTQVVAGRKKNKIMPVVIFNETGQGYNRIEKALEGTEITAFYLKGGLNAYKKYLQDLALSWQPRESRLKTSGNCQPCGTEREDDSQND
jgi:hypothetical protein